MSPACNSASLPQNPDSKPTNVFPPITKFSAAGASVFSEFTQGLQPDLKIVSKTHSPVRSKGVCLRQLSKNVIYTVGEEELHFIMMS
jgi:hypothetical protein